MDWAALVLSLELAAATALVLLPLAVVLARELAWRRFAGKAVVEAAVALPLVLPPTVLGYYLLVAFAPASPLGHAFAALTGGTLVFSFAGLLAASIVFNLPFAVQPVQRAFEAIPEEVREAGWLCGMSGWRTLWRVELPLAWPGLLSAFVLTFAHTLGEFGVVVMLGGNIPGKTKVASIALYDEVQKLNYDTAHTYALLLLVIAFVMLLAITMIQRKIAHDA